jgi:hypothetical protein
MGVGMLLKFRDEGFIVITRVTQGEEYRGSVAVFVIVVTLGVGVALTAWCVLVWWRSRRHKD